MSKKKNIFDLNFDKGKIITYGTIFISLVIIISFVGIIFFPTSNIGFTELSLLNYDEELETYIAYDYPTHVFRIRNITTYFMVKNFENRVTYYQLQVKATKLSQNISLLEPLSSSNSVLMYNNDTFEKILSSAKNNEKKEPVISSNHFTWGPVNVTLYLNNDIDIIIGGEGRVKIVFELWKFDTEMQSFTYSGVFTFLELRIAYG